MLNDALAALLGGNMPGFQGLQVEQDMPQGGVGEDIVASSRQPLEHKGMFGLSGTPRNILGLLGDAFLVQAGKDPLYQGVRQAERYGDAMLNFEDDEVGSIAKARAVDPKRAGEDWKQYQDNTIANLKEAREAAKMGFDIANATEKQAWDRYKHQGEVLDRASRIFHGPAVDAESYPHIKKLYEQYLSEQGVSSPVSLPDTYDANAVQRAISQGLSIEDAAQLKGNEAYRDGQLANARVGNVIRAANTAVSAANTGVSAARVAADVAEIPSKVQDRLTPTKRGSVSVPARAGGPPDASKYPPTAGRVLRGKNGKEWRGDGKRWLPN